MGHNEGIAEPDSSKLMAQWYATFERAGGTGLIPNPGREHLGDVPETFKLVVVPMNKYWRGCFGHRFLC